MTKPLVVIDDDINLVEELRLQLLTTCPSLVLAGSPDMPLELSAIRAICASARAVILDLDIGGSVMAGREILRGVHTVLEKSDIPVVVWSKYFPHTVLYESGGVVRVDHSGSGQNRVTDLTGAAMAHLPGASRIADLKKIYRGTRTFVTKLVPDPVQVLIQMLHRAGVIPPELLR